MTNTSSASTDDQGLQALAFWAQYQGSVFGVDPSCVLNMDETSLTYDDPGRRVFAARGANSVQQRTRGKEKNTVTVALCASRVGDRLAPFIIYRGNF